MLETECQGEREKCNKGVHSYKTQTVCTWIQQASGSTKRTSPEALKHSESFVVHLTSGHGTSYVTFAYVTKENLEKFMVNVTYQKLFRGLQISALHFDYLYPCWRFYYAENRNKSFVFGCIVFCKVYLCIMRLNFQNIVLPK